MTTTTCSFCHEPNNSEVRFCGCCGHEAQVPRIACTCPRCYPKERIAALAAASRRSGGAVIGIEDENGDFIIRPAGEKREKNKENEHD